MKQTKKTKEKLMFKKDNDSIIFKKINNSISIKISNIEDMGGDKQILTLANMLSIVIWMKDIKLQII